MYEKSVSCSTLLTVCFMFVFTIDEDGKKKYRVVNCVLGNGFWGVLLAWEEMH